MEPLKENSLFKEFTFMFQKQIAETSEIHLKTAISH